LHTLPVVVEVAAAVLVVAVIVEVNIVVAEGGQLGRWRKLALQMRS